MILRDVLPRVRCVHVADTAVRGELEPTIIGSGVVDFHAIFGLLKEYAYDEWFSVEEASGQIPYGIERAVDFIRQRWEG
jgi:sugar phosphate isomerase/epimerase